MGGSLLGTPLVPVAEPVLSRDPQWAPAPVPVPDVKVKFCTECGAKTITHGVKFCSDCGAKAP